MEAPLMRPAPLRPAAVPAHPPQGTAQAAVKPQPPRYLTNAEAAAFLRLSPRTLEKQRVIGGGARFDQFGRRMMYALVDLDTWAAARSFETTFDPEYPYRHQGAQRDDQ